MAGLGRQLCLCLRGQLDVLQRGCQQAAAVSQATTAYAWLYKLQLLAANLQHTHQLPGAWHTYSSSSSSSRSAAAPGADTRPEASSSSSSSTLEAEVASSQSQQPLASPSPAATEQQQPVAGAAYGPRKIIPRSTKATAGAIRREGVVHVNSTFNNTIMVLTDRDSKVQTWTSGGTVGYKNANKATPMAAELAAKELARRALDMGFHSVVVKLKGMGKNKQFAVQSLAANGLTVTQLWDVTPIPYNGCRLPRRRRV